MNISPKYLTTFSPDAVAKTCLPAQIIWLFEGWPLSFTWKCSNNHHIIIILIAQATVMDALILQRSSWSSILPFWPGSKIRYIVWQWFCYKQLQWVLKLISWKVMSPSKKKRVWNWKCLGLCNQTVNLKTDSKTLYYSILK